MRVIVTRTAMVLAALGMALVALSSLASAQYEPTDPDPDPEVAGTTGQLAYTGPFSSSPGSIAGGNSGALGFAGVNAQPSADASTGGVVGGTGGGLAATGSDVSVPLLAGISLMGVGGVSLVASRRREF